MGEKLNPKNKKTLYPTHSSFSSETKKHLLLRGHAELLIGSNCRRLVDALVLGVLLNNVGGALEGEVVITVLGEGVLLRVHVLEGEPEDDGEDAADNGWSTEIPGQVGVTDDGGAGEADSVGNGGVEEVERRDETPHVLWGARVGDTVGGDVDEELRDTSDGEGDGHVPDADGGDQGDAVSVNTVVGTELAARAELVGVVVEDGVADTTNGGHGETGGDASNGAEVNVALAQEGVEAVVENRSTANDTERVEVVDDVVGDTVGDHHGGQETGRGTDTVVVNVLDGEETEDTGGLESAANILNELVVPPHWDYLARSSNDGRLCGLPEAVTADSLPSTLREADSQNAEDVGQITSCRWVKNKALAEVPEKEGERKVEDEREEEAQPEADVLLSVGSSDLHESTDVDEKVKPEHDSLSRGLWVDDDSLARLQGLDLGDGVWHLIEKQRRHIRLEHS